jgi:ABC-2 type transport system permease protein
VKHVSAIAGRELYSFFFSPVAYVVLTLWSVLAGTFFLTTLLGFQEELRRAEQFQNLEALSQLNLNDQLITPFIGSMWIILLFLLPAVTMGLFANEKANGTIELLLTSPITIWEIVIGKLLAGAGFIMAMIAIVAFFPGVLFVYGNPELGKTLSALFGLTLVSLAYMSVGAFASSVTRNQLIAFFLALVLLLVLGLLLPFIADIGFGGGDTGKVGEVLRYIATGPHFESMLQGLVETKDVVYFLVVIGVFLLLSKSAVESARWL